jgi:outer membrane murein-binding lipoprotein Lpp
MPISLNKFENLIGEKGILIRKIFTISKEAVYIEVFNINEAESFIVYIPSKYTMKVSKRSNTYKIKYLEITEGEDFIIKEKEKEEVSNDYDEIELDPEKNHENLEKSLKENYDKPVSLNNVNTEDKDNIKDIFYQLSRLRLCVQNLNYKLSIIYKNYLCAIKKDNTIECYSIKNYQETDQRKIYVSLDLETLYSKIDTLHNDIKSIKNGIYKVLEQNQLKNAKILNNILEKKDTITLYSNSIYTKKNELNSYLNQLENMLKKINENEFEILEKIKLIDDKYKDSRLDGLQNDIDRTREISMYEKKLDHINNVKQELIKEIIILKIKQENMILLIDKILFDNSVMMNTIINNFTVLSKII